MYRICTKCNIQKIEETDFTNRSSTSNLKRSVCKSCEAAYRSLRRAPGLKAKREAKEKKRLEEEANSFKKCTGCFLEKPKTAFNKAKTGKEGLTAWCKECYQTWAKNNKEATTRKQKEYREKNVEIIKERKRKHYHANKKLKANTASRGYSYWNNEDRCRAEALKYHTRKAFILNSGSAYNAARRNGWLDMICSHMQSLKVRQGYWEVFENCLKESLKYETQREFCKSSPGAYNSAYKNGWLPEICQRFERRMKERGHWSFENCSTEALKYSSRIDFVNNSSSAYHTAHRNGWLELICQHMEALRQEKGFWNYKNCEVEALKYDTRSEFKKLSPSAYSAAIKHGWLELLCSHMQPQASGFIRMCYALEFPEKNEVYIGISSNPSKRKWQHLTIREGVCLSSNKFVRANIENFVTYEWIIFKEIATKLNAKDLESKMIQFYKEQGWQLLNIAAPGALGSNRLYWTKNRCEKEAKKYDSRTAFCKGSSSAYNSAKIHGWLDLICKHMQKKRFRRKGTTGANKIFRLKRVPKNQLSLF